VHTALDQVGAFAGPLLVAGVIAVAGVQWPAFAVLAVPGAACMLLLFTLKRHTEEAVLDSSAPAAPQEVPPDTSTGESHRRTRRTVGAVLRLRYLARARHPGVDDIRRHRLPPRHRWTRHHRGGAADLRRGDGTEAVAALATGFAYDRWGAAALYTLPAAIIAVPALALADTLTVVVAGVLLWGAFQGVAALAGGTLAGGLYTERRTLLITVVAATQVLSAVLLFAALRQRHHHPVG
jgi:hypothetical protein